MKPSEKSPELLTTNIKRPTKPQHLPMKVKSESTASMFDELKAKKREKARQRRKTLALNNSRISFDGSSSVKKEKSPEEVIADYSKEIDALQNEIKVARERCSAIVDSQQNWKTFLEGFEAHRNQMLHLKENLDSVITRDIGSRADVEESSEFMGDVYLKSFDNFAEQMRTTKVLFESLKNYIEKTQNYQKVRSEFDKLIVAFTTADGKLQKMNKEKRPDINKVGQFQQQKEEAFTALESEGEKAVDAYVEMYNLFLTSLLHSSVDISDKVQREVDNWKKMVKDKGEKLNVWKTLNIGETVKNTSDEFPKWMEEFPIFIHISEEENHMTKSMEQCVVKYAKSLLCSPTLATSGLSMADINLIFSDIESLHMLHGEIVNDILISKPETFIDIFYTRIGKIYEVYKRRCRRFKDTMKKLNECLKITQFKETVESINNQNADQPKLIELLTLPFTNLNNLHPFFTILKNDLPEEKEKINKIIIVLGWLIKMSEQAEDENEVEEQLVKIKDIKNIESNPDRKYLDRIQCVYNKTQGTLFLFSDMFIFTRLDKSEYFYDDIIDVRKMKTFRVKGKKTITLETEGEPIDLGFRDTTMIEKCSGYLSSIKYEMEKVRIFSVELTTSCFARKEEQFLIPRVIHQIFDKLELEAPNLEGIFRISVSVKELEQTMKQIDLNPQIDLKEMNGHLLGNVLKKYLNLLPNKFPSSLQTVDPSDFEGIKNLLEPMGKNFVCLTERLFRLLHLISENNAENKMTSENLATVISPNIYQDDDSDVLNTEKLTRTVRVMIDKYFEIFGELKTSIDQKLEEGMKEMNVSKEFEKEMETYRKFSEIPVSKLVEGNQDDKSVVLTLKDIVKQGDVDILDGKKWSRRWAVMKKNCLMLFRNVGDGQTLNVFPLKGLMVATDNKNDKKCIVLKAEKQSVIISFEQHEEWLELLTTVS